MVLRRAPLGRRRSEMKRAYLRECRLNLHTGKWEATQSVWIIDRASFEDGGSTIPTVRELLRDAWAEAGKCTALMAPEHRPLHILVSAMTCRQATWTTAVEQFLQR